MFDKIKDFFSSDADLQVTASGEATPKDLLIATAVLLLEIAGIDEDYAPEEVQACFKTMEEQFSIEDDDILAIMEQAEKARSSVKIDNFIHAINVNFNDQQKQKVLAMVWKIILADELVDKYEQRFASKLRKRLELSREQAEEAKSMASGGDV